MPRLRADRHPAPPRLLCPGRPDRRRVSRRAAAAIVGDNIGYLIGRRGGRALLLLPGPFQAWREAFLKQGEPFFERHGPKAVFLGRWTSVLRIAVAWLAGAHRMRWSVFSFWNALGAIAWASVVGLLAYLLGPVVEHFFAVFGLASALVGAALVFVLLGWRRRHRGSRPNT